MKTIESTIVEADNTGFTLKTKQGNVEITLETDSIDGLIHDFYQLYVNNMPTDSICLVEDSCLLHLDSIVVSAKDNTSYDINGEPFSTHPFLKESGIIHEVKNTEHGDVMHSYFLNLNEALFLKTPVELFIDAIVEEKDRFKDQSVFRKIEKMINGDYSVDGTCILSSAHYMDLEDQNVFRECITKTQTLIEDKNEQLLQLRNDALTYLSDQKRDIDYRDVVVFGRIMEVDESGFTLQKKGQKYDIPLNMANEKFSIGELIKVKIDDQLNVNIERIEQKKGIGI